MIKKNNILNVLFKTIFKIFLLFFILTQTGCSTFLESLFNSSDFKNNNIGISLKVPSEWTLNRNEETVTFNGEKATVILKGNRGNDTSAFIPCFQVVITPKSGIIDLPTI